MQGCDAIAHEDAGTKRCVLIGVGLASSNASLAAGWSFYPGTAQNGNTDVVKAGGVGGYTCYAKHDTPYRLIRSGTCASAGLRPITLSSTCEAAAAALKLFDITVDTTDNTPRPEGCYLHQGTRLWLATNSANKGKGAETSAGSTPADCHPICTASGASVA